MYRPSSLPALAVCPKFRSGLASEFAIDGTYRHLALQDMFENGGVLNLDKFTELDQQSVDGIEWAHFYINQNAPLDRHPLEIESPIKAKDEQGETMSEGTSDYYCGNHLFDIKWRRRNYREQLAAYALGVMAVNFETKIEAHILYMESQQVEVIHFTESEAISIVRDTITKAEDKQAQPQICDYCGWCSELIRCPRYLEKVNWLEEQLTGKITKLEGLWIENDSDDLNAAAILAKIVAKWAKRAEASAKDYALNGGYLANFQLRSRAAPREVADIAKAFEMAELDKEEFLNLCTLTFGKIEKFISTQEKISLSKAKKETERRIGNNIKHKEPSYYLKQI